MKSKRSRDKDTETNLESRSKFFHSAHAGTNCKAIK